MSVASSRRGFLLGAGALGLAPPRGDAAGNNGDDIKLAVATYSLRGFQRDLAVKMIQDLNIRYASVKEFHLPYNDTPRQLADGRKKFQDAGIEVVSGGVIYLTKDDDADVRRYFDYAKACGMPMMVIGPTAETMPRIGKFVKEYNIKVAIHNHGPEDKHFPTPQSALRIVKDMDPRCGICIDAGHAARAGADLVESIREAGPRLFDIHIKDLRAINKDTGCPVGEGVLPIVGMFKELKKMNYSGTVSLEYEIEEDNPFTGMKASFAYMRGVLAGLRG
ncbi:MAG: sugar phosphate isomerase/epimerase [Acidobacteriia bacterium]|nr:sugar phosphate isomerase/epimerase [Terriglobia bacterium]